jgi:hypothetical protein
MTQNPNKMKNSKKCFPLDIEKKMKISIDTNGKIIFLNDYFLEFTDYNISELVLKDITEIMDEEMPISIQNKLLELTDQYDEFYFIIKGQTKNNTCYWGFTKVTPRVNQSNVLSGHIIEVKTLPSVAIENTKKLFEILKEIENNAGIEAANKYLEGWLEEKHLDFYNFILKMVQVNEKNANKYFELGNQSKKKKSWF